MFFDGWEGILRTLLVGVLAYLGLVILVRLSGKRTLGKMNAFDLVVSVALGSTLATVLLSQDVALAEGLVAFALLIGMQLALTWGSVRSRRLRGLVKSQPTLMAYRGQELPDALRAQRVTHDELLQAVRQQGHASLADVHAVVLETDGSFSVVDDMPSGASAMRNVDGWGDRPNGQSS